MKANEPVGTLVERQRAFFNTGATRSVAFRKAQLEKLHAAILAHEADILEATRIDLGKSDFESYVTEVSLVLEEIKLMKRRVGKWARPERRGARAPGPRAGRDRDALPGTGLPARQGTPAPLSAGRRAGPRTRAPRPT